MLKFGVEVAPECIKPFSPILMKLLSQFTEVYIHASPAMPGYDVNIHLIMAILDSCQTLVAFLGDQHR